MKTSGDNWRVQFTNVNTCISQCHISDQQNINLQVFIGEFIKENYIVNYDNLPDPHLHEWLIPCYHPSPWQCWLSESWCQFYLWWTFSTSELSFAGSGQHMSAEHRLPPPWPEEWSNCGSSSALCHIQIPQLEYEAGDPPASIAGAATQLPYFFYQ